MTRYRDRRNISTPAIEIDPVVLTSAVPGQDGQLVVATDQGNTFLWVRVSGVLTPAVSSSGGSASSHNTLSGLQGGTTGEYYHLTESGYNNLVEQGDLEDYVQLTETDIREESGELVFEDSSGTATLTTLKSMKNIWITASGQAPGNLTLSGVHWGAEYSYIDSMRVKTESTDWSLWLCEDDTFDTDLITSRLLVSGMSGDIDLGIARSYNAGVTSVFLIYEDNSGSNTADFYITGEARRH